MRSALQLGKRKAAKYIPALLLVVCPQPRHGGGSGGHGPSATTSLLPAGPPGTSPAAVSRCPFYLNALAPPVLQACSSTAITLALPSEGNIIPASPCLQQLAPPAPVGQAEQPAPREGGSLPRIANGCKIKPGVCCQACCSCSRTHILPAVQKKRVFLPSANKRCCPSEAPL